MATTSKFITDFRLAITNMMNSFDDVNSLINVYQAMGWNEASFATDLENSDITAADFVATIDAFSAMQAPMADLIGLLTKLRA